MFRALMRFIKNQKPMPKGAVSCHSIDELFEKDDPWYTNAYYAVYRFFKWNWIFHPTKWYHNTKYFIQRGVRGWADRDTWSLDYYLNSWMPEALQYLKDHSHGIPGSLLCQSKKWWRPWAKPWEYTPIDYKKAEAEWNTIMGKMIEGFRASARMNEGLYEKELGEYPLRRPEGTSKETWKQLKHERLMKSEELMDRDEAIRTEGMTLFVKYYNSLWD